MFFIRCIISAKATVLTPNILLPHDCPAEQKSGLISPLQSILKPVCALPQLLHIGYNKTEDFLFLFFKYKEEEENVRQRHLTVGEVFTEQTSEGMEVGANSLQGRARFALPITMLQSQWGNLDISLPSCLPCPQALHHGKWLLIDHSS